MRTGRTCLAGLGLALLVALPAIAAGSDNTGSGDLVPGGWLQPPVPPTPPEAAKPAPAEPLPQAPAAATPAPVPPLKKPPRPKVTHRAAEPPASNPNPTGQVRF